MKRLIRQFLQLESSGGLILLMMAILAMLWANSPLADLHRQFTDHFLFAINEGLMALFFLLVGLELKRGFLEGELSTFSHTALPLIAALGGMIVPVIFYWSFNYHNPVTLKGWATPVATDIAFALGVLSLFGRRIPGSLKLFLLALAIFDDLGAILIIAVFYTHGLSVLWLCWAAVCVCVLYLLNRFSVGTLIPYIMVGVCLWFSLLHSGIHPTISGVVLAFFVPADSNKKQSQLHRLENILHPWAAYFIMPVFALANAGVSLQGLSWTILTSDVVMGIALGLFLGKQIGVFGFSWIMIRARFASLPVGSTWRKLYGVAILCGIGFTMSLFLGTLSFQNEGALYLSEVRLGVIIGSILSGLVGAMVLLKE